MSWFPSIFWQSHFKQLLCYLHLANNEQDPPRDTSNKNNLFKLGLLPAKLSKSINQMYAPKQELYWSAENRDKVSYFLHSVHAKEPKKFGVKIWALWSGHLCQVTAWAFRFIPGRLIKLFSTGFRIVWYLTCCKDSLVKDIMFFL